MLEYKTILEWLKLTGKQAFILLTISSILLFSPESIVFKLGLVKIKEISQPWVGGVWVVSLAILLVEFIHPIYLYIKNEIVENLTIRRGYPRLKQLTQKEKEFLRFYIENDTRTNSAKYANGVVKELEAACIVRRASNIASYGDVFPFNIQPWAWEYLRKNPELLN